MNFQLKWFSVYGRVGRYDIHWSFISWNSWYIVYKLILDMFYILYDIRHFFFKSLFQWNTQSNCPLLLFISYIVFWVFPLWLGHMTGIFFFIKVTKCSMSKSYNTFISKRNLITITHRNEIRENVPQKRTDFNS